MTECVAWWYRSCRILQNWDTCVQKQSCIYVASEHRCYESQFLKLSAWCCFLIAGLNMLIIARYHLSEIATFRILGPPKSATSPQFHTPPQMILSTQCSNNNNRVSNKKVVQWKVCQSPCYFSGALNASVDSHLRMCTVVYANANQKILKHCVHVLG